MFALWSREVPQSITTSPRSLMRLANRSINRRRQANGMTADSAGFQRRIAFELTLLTFCPPGPELRAKDQASSAAGMVISDVTGRSRAIYEVGLREAEFCRGARGTHFPLPDKPDSGAQ